MNPEPQITEEERQDLLRTLDEIDAATTEIERLLTLAETRLAEQERAERMERLPVLVAYVLACAALAVIVLLPRIGG